MFKWPSWFRAPTVHPTVIRVVKHPATWASIAVVIVGGYEGERRVPYYDMVGVKTVCNGATAADGVDLNRTYMHEECQELLKNDLQKYDREMRKCIRVPLPPHREAALVSLTYNIGWGALCKSSVARDMNAGRTKKACDDFLAYDKAGGQVVKGLAARRQSERQLCLMEN